MASLPRQCGPVRQLREYLKEQQEPFLLEVYLCENGYPWKSLNLDYACNCWPGDIDSSKKLRRFSKKGSKKKSLNSLKCSRLVRAVLKIIRSGRSEEMCDFNGVSSDNRKLSHSSCVSDMGRDTSLSSSFFHGNVGERNCSVFQHYNVFPTDDDDDDRDLRQYCLINTQKASSDTTIVQRRFMEEWKQLSPVSVLELASEEGSLAHKHKSFSQRTYQEEFQSNLPHNWDFLLLSIKEKMGIEDQELQELHWLHSSSHTANNKKVLRQSKQLLFDCVKEAMDNGMKKRRWCCSQPSMETKVLCDEIYAWGRQEGDVTNISQLLERDLSSQEWGHTEPHIKEEIADEIADSIFESISHGLISDYVSLL